MEAKLYYTPPTQEAFEDMRSSAMILWGIVASHPSYAEEKIRRIKDIQNVSDNFMYILAMFDSGKQRRLAMMLKPETRREAYLRMIDGGASEWECDHLK
jgi:hypothetical protein